jgi:hypothetical protein
MVQPLPQVFEAVPLHLRPPTGAVRRTSPLMPVQEEIWVCVRSIPLNYCANKVSGILSARGGS